MVIDRLAYKCLGAFNTDTYSKISCFIFEGNCKANSSCIPASFSYCQQRALLTHPMWLLPLDHEDFHFLWDASVSHGFSFRSGGFSCGTELWGLLHRSSRFLAYNWAYEGCRLSRLLEGHQIRKIPKCLFWRESNRSYIVFLKQKSGGEGNKDKEIPEVWYSAAHGEGAAI